MNPKFNCARPKNAALAAAAILALILASSAFASGPLEKVIYNFQGGTGVLGTAAGLIADSTGNLYGTGGGGTFDNGTVFELSPPPSGQAAWTLAVLYSFQGGSDGSEPIGDLVFDGAGNLYGTTSGGGNDEGCGLGCGTVFELSPPATEGGAWTETVLFSFPANCTQGCYPESTLVLDDAGNLYGTTYNTVFELSPPVAGQTQLGVKLCSTASPMKPKGFSPATVWSFGARPFTVRRQAAVPTMVLELFSSWQAQIRGGMNMFSLHSPILVPRARTRSLV